MYQPREFGDSDQERAWGHILRNPFGILVSGSGGLAATHLPFLLEAGDEEPPVLVSHFARRNPQWRSLHEGNQVLCIFPGPNAYVTAGAYRAEPDVPTWNYTAVHIRGTYSTVAAGAETIMLLENTVRTFEALQPEPWQTETLSRDSLSALAREVVGFRIQVTGVKGGYKLSQDKMQEDVQAVISQLDHGSAQDVAVAEEMRRHEVAGRTDPPNTSPRDGM